MKIGIFCYHNEPYKCVAEVTMPVLRKYCEKHGYGYHVSGHELPDRYIMWKLVPDLLGGFADYDWCVHLNTDAIITNHAVKIESLLDKHLVIPTVLDHNLQIVLNDGFLAVKNSPEGKCLLEKIWRMGDGTNPNITCPLNAIDALYKTNKVASDMMNIVKQNSCNSFLYTEYGLPETTVGHWQPGDFILHLPGRTNTRRVELFTEWLPKIQW